VDADPEFKRWLRSVDLQHRTDIPHWWRPVGQHHPVWATF